MNILITGSKGFIGSNLKKALLGKCNIVEYNREDSIEVLQNIDDIDVIFHLAGEVNPKLNEKEIFDGNITLSRVLSNILKKTDKEKLIIFTSSIHAKNEKNAYGKSKREAEKIFEKVAFETKHKVVIYRLPHLFGEGCKPHHNSVVTTWIDNCIRGEEIVVFDKNIKINYTYIKDLINDLMYDIKNLNNEFLVYKKPSVIHSTTLGYVSDKICFYKDVLEQGKQYKTYSNFDQKLFKTIEYYFKIYKGKI